MKRLLIIGGSGGVAGLIVPHLVDAYQVRVFDLKPPRTEGCEYVAGSVCCIPDLVRATEGMDLLLYMAMGSHKPVNGDAWASDEARTSAFDVSVKGLYLALEAAHRAGIEHAVYTSSMSVYKALDWNKKDQEKTYFTDEDLPPDSQMLYGLTKRLGEEVCRNATREWGMSINAMRLCLPVTDERYQEITAGDKAKASTTIATTGGDTARAIAAALEFRCGFQAFNISGDYAEKMMSMKKAKTLLGWEPLARPLGDIGDPADVPGQ